MSEKEELFRNEALSAIDDNSDVMEHVRVTTPSLTAILVALAVCCAIAVCWCFFGTTNIKINASGIAFPHANLEVQSLPFDGRVMSVSATHGSYVSKGTPIMTVLTETAQSSIAAEKSGVILSYKPVNEAFKANEPVVYMLPQPTEHAGREVIALVKFHDLRWIHPGLQVQVTPSDLTREDYGYATGRVISVDPYPISQTETEEKLRLAQFSKTIFPNEAAYEVKILLDETDGHLNWSRAKSRHLTFPTGSFCNVQIVTRTLKIYELLIFKLNAAACNIQGK